MISFSDLQHKGNAGEISLGAQVVNVFVQAGNVTLNVTVLMAATNKAVPRR